ncbi:deoxycytidylate deaminase [Rhodobacterales bacterium HKCCE4037]|nr:deoxycytidylate deaminase [Rhodobacterales bacterium HKCCE4037]
MPQYPELVIGLVGPIGCPIHEAGDALAAAFKAMDYSPTSIHLSREMDRLLLAKKAEIPSDGESILENKIKKGNAVRTAFKNDSVLAAEAIRQIVEFRKQNARDMGYVTDDDIDARALIPLDRKVFIIHQLKREEEIELLNRVFGKRFIQVSVVNALDDRKSALVARLQSEQPGWDLEKCEVHSAKLIKTDQNESLQDRGQRISKIFHLGDVFINGNSEAALQRSSMRFVESLFGRNSISPSRDEFGSYMAKAASLRSVDLSRQVGAAIMTKEGDIISVGCNEVPKFGGGNYWDDDPDEVKRRDIDMGGEANKSEVNRIVFNFIEVLSKQGLMKGDKSTQDILEDPEHRKAIKKSLIGGITEYGRMVHAEMNALSDAVRLGRSVRGATIYVTTYPCHNCAKHLIASGVDRIVFIEPYPKSKAESLFKDILAPDKENSDVVSIEHFFGISPRRYRDIFEKEMRQTSDGEVQKWYKGFPEPRLGSLAVGVSGSEIQAIVENLYS